MEMELFYFMIERFAEIIFFLRNFTTNHRNEWNAKKIDEFSCQFKSIAIQFWFLEARKDTKGQEMGRNQHWWR